MQNTKRPLARPKPGAAQGPARDRAAPGWAVLGAGRAGCRLVFFYLSCVSWMQGQLYAKGRGAVRASKARTILPLPAALAILHCILLIAWSPAVDALFFRSTLCSQALGHTLRHWTSCMAFRVSSKRALTHMGKPPLPKWISKDITTPFPCCESTGTW